MWGRRIGALAVTGIMAGSLATTVGFGSAGAGAAPATFRTSVGDYTGWFTFTGQTTFSDPVTLKADGHFAIAGGGPTGTWSQPNLAGVIVLQGTDKDQETGKVITYTFSAQKYPTSLGTQNHQGTVVVGGKTVATWYATISSP
jgi:hypothetical protein